MSVRHRRHFPDLLLKQGGGGFGLRLSLLASEASLTPGARRHLVAFQSRHFYLDRSSGMGKNRFRITGPHKIYPPANRCIYCGSTDDLSDEHIIPFSLGGNVVLPKASCGKCRDATHAFEGQCAGAMMLPLRARMNIQTRNPKKRPSTFEIPILSPSGEKRVASFQADKVPFCCIGIRLDPPTFVSGDEPTGRVRGDLFARPTMNDWSEHLGPGDAAMLGKISVVPFCRLIAKIGHAHVMAALVAEGVHPPIEDLFLPSIILGHSNEFQHYVGGDTDPLDTPDALHQLRFNRYIFGERKILVSTVRLFALFGMPRYHVIACYEPRT